MPEIIIISDDDVAQTGISEQAAASSWLLADVALHREQVIAASSLHPQEPDAQCSDVAITARHSRSRVGDHIPHNHLTASSIPELPDAAGRNMIGITLNQESAITVANLSALSPLPQSSDAVMAALNSHSSDISTAIGPRAGPLGSRHAMHAYFAQFAGCRNSAIEVEPALPCDADALDLRRALPPIQWPPQFMDLESVHVDAFLGDSSGRSMDSFSGSNSLDSFIDDAPEVISATDAANVAQFVADMLPITAELLRLPDPSPATVAASKRRRWIISSSSSSPPQALPQHVARRRIVASSSPSPPVLAARVDVV
jgi:hypothetical protein